MKNIPNLAFVRTPQGSALSSATLVFVLLIAAFASTTAQAGVTDISNQPLATQPNVQAKPNLLFILDNSGSMGSNYMPDDMSNSSAYGFWSTQCNGLAYDPTMTYAPPLYSTGLSYPNASLTATKDDGYNASSTTRDIFSASNNYNIYYQYSGTQPKMSWTYTSSGLVSNTFSQECFSGTSSASTVFTTMVTMTRLSSDAQNYANWYSYYRKRYLLMRTAMGRAISSLDSNYRVGFSTISDAAAVDGTNLFRDVKDFDNTQKANFYSSLYTASPSGNTPLRGALSKAGRYFANKVSGQTYDPMQYSCQRNYALLSTDGYWNTGLESSTYGPLKLDGTTLVGQQDGTESRPMRDSAKNILTTVTPYTASATRNQVSVTQTRTQPWTKTTVSSTGPGTNTNGGKTVNNCTKTGYYLVTTLKQTYTETQTQVFNTPQAATASYNHTVVSTDGVTSSTTDSAISYSTWSNSAAATTATTDNGAPTDASYSIGSPTQVCQLSAGTSGTTVTPGSWSSWTPATITYTYTTPSPGTYVAGTPTTTTTTSGGSLNTLADVAEYYYTTDLRDSSLGNCTSTSSGSSQDVCANIVRPVGSDKAATQHMDTFTIGLGVSGTLPYDKNYLTQTTGSYVSLTNGTLDWPTPQATSSGGNATNVDDLWHAAVNGRGQYYSALNASLLHEAINGVITAVQQVSGSASAASTSSLELVAGNNNQVYRASYTTQSWTGDLQAFTLNGADATIATTPSWSSQALLDTASPSARKIYYRQPSASTTLRQFTYANLTSDNLNSNFDNLCTQGVVASQCATLSTTDKALANTGSNLVNYLRGERSFESSTSTTAALYRKRDHVQGDIINGAPVHVGKPPFSYADSGYADFVTAQASRKPVVYTAANDGMLHAFSADITDGGAELWAYIPASVMPNLYKLADASYGAKHQYFVDGAPVMADIQMAGVWKTILVGGLNDGGRSYYALDITDPLNPKSLWEFTDTNLGYSFGNPVIAKRADGTWVVAFASGYNNTSGDGKGHLYVVNANTGAKLLDIATSAGSPTDPSGLAKINAWVDSTTDNTAKRFYGGDLQGNLWRFDIDNLVQPNQGAMQLAKFQIDATTPQPITTKPETALVSGQPVVLVATGRYLGVGDITDSTQQSIYGVKDTFTSMGWGDVRANTANFVKQTFTVSGSSASVTNTAVNWAIKGGWWVDMPNTRERVITNMSLQFGTLAIASAIPNGDACSSGGSGWRYYLNVTNGGVVTTNPVGTQWSAIALIVGMTWVKDSNGNSRIVFQNSNGDIKSEIPPTVSSSGAGSAHRTSWRELTD